MTQKSQQRAIANKIKKWLKAAMELSHEKITLALPITRLTSIKSLCTDETAAQNLALYLSQRVQQEMNQAEPSPQLSPLLSLSEIDPYSDWITGIFKFEFLLLEKN